MKNVIVRTTGGPEVLEIVEQSKPDCGPGEIVIQARAMAVSKPDVLIRQGLYAWSPPLPANPGNELAGIVDSIGEGVQDFVAGQSVLLSSRELPIRGGCYAEFIAVPANCAHALPAGVALEQAVVLPSYVVAHAMLTLATAGQRVQNIFVNGAAGVIGGALTELAKIRLFADAGHGRVRRDAAVVQTKPRAQSL